MKKNHNERPRAIMLHGAGGGGWEWDIWRRVFQARGWSVVASDLQPVAAGLATTQLDDYVDQAVSWAQDKTHRTRNSRAPENPVAKPVLIGASLGGLLALIAASCTPPAALVLINPMAPQMLGSAHIEPGLAQREYPAVIAWGSRRSFASTLRAMPDADDAARRFAHHRWRDESGAVLRSATKGVCVDAVHCPTLIFGSERDEDVPVSVSRALADACAAEFRLLTRMSHVGPLLGRHAACVAEQAAQWSSGELQAR